MIVPLKGTEDALAFYDVRKFGCAYLLEESEIGPLASLGKEPFEIENPEELYVRFQKSSKPIKEMLLDQTIMAGLGNIYADETCFRAKISPFLPANQLSLEDTKRILVASQQILTAAIEHCGSTVRSYRSSSTHAGEFQEFLQVYGKEGKECRCCHKFKIEKRRLSGRGTCYCPNCQHTGINVAITGKIASGKSLATSYFRKEGFVTFSADEEVHKMYADEEFLKQLKASFPNIFTPELDKKKITELLNNDPLFKRRYLQFIFKEVKRRVNAFIIENDGKDKALEIPVLFDAHMQKDFTYLVGTETTRQEEHLKERGEKVERKNFNRMNSYDLHRKELDFILNTDGTKRELRRQVVELIAEMKKRQS